MTAPIQLIVNADDYGYFPCVSRGILEAAHAGSLTATGILANNPDLTTQLKWLDAVPQLDLGVQLNLTFQQPLTAVMGEKLARWKGCFPNAYLMSLLILTGRISVATVREEWCAQIEACQSKKLVFLNSHEHIHMLPVLFPLVLELAKVYNIPHVRLTQAEWLKPLTGAGLIRNTLMQAMQTFNQPRIKTPTPLFLGLSRSGRLDYDALALMFSTLKAGQSYELMCHAGHFDASEITDPHLIAYHDWEAELALLQSPELQDLYQRFNIRLSHYSHLPN
ncbi:MAG: ChbG/HpnK family deacetylase [Methylococcaceae bacterium]|nr:ChbG/HpnK family deacetylase [Methylococcaceae bacterium]